MAITSKTRSMAEALARLAHKDKFGVALNAEAKKTVDAWVERRWREYLTDAQFLISVMRIDR